MHNESVEIVNDLITVIEANDYSYLAWTGIESPINYNSCPLTCNALTFNYADTLAKSETLVNNKGEQ